ncbi:VOC family protein [Streptacidiphilus fuscans]|uniref:Glyoxalase n=1 Tax=Streptacidiphilus fuscans TaxID=2789292 RepID=A0A931B227_9ACTN|nr:VOC family protein [Streptacidiphilus fuscans]MBF9067807.1 glyoxalase [Streptacidiphilus fuscans]MBF9073890.1 glyoxalase [Streptacidiphilus fuscans]
MIVALDHVQLAAPPGTEDTLRAFYIDVLGLTEIPKPPVLAARGGAWFATADGSVQIHVGVEDPFVPAKKAHPAVRVRGIRGYAEEIAAKGAEVVWDDNLPGHDRFYSFDPVGNRIEFLEPRA